MSRLIDADKLPFEKMEISATSEEWCVRLSDIEFAPTVDAVEVVRCKDCRHKTVDCKTVDYNMRTTYIYLCLLHGTYHEQDWFCADGERKTD